jgi:hypothetical protein
LPGTEFLHFACCFESISQGEIHFLLPFPRFFHPVSGFFKRFLVKQSKKIEKQLSFLLKLIIPEKA